MPDAKALVDRPDPADSEPASERLHNTESECEVVEAIIEAGADHRAHSWQYHVQEKANASPRFGTLNNRTLACLLLQLRMLFLD